MISKKSLGEVLGFTPDVISESKDGKTLDLYEFERVSQWVENQYQKN